MIGDGNNFVRTMASLADRGIAPQVVDDQFGRLTFTDDLAAGIVHLLEHERPVRHLQPDQRRPDAVSWADIAGACSRCAGAPAVRSPGDHRRLRRRQARDGPAAAHSTLDLTKIAAVGFEAADADHRLREYLAE